jgi:pilus assembly protein CpaE
MAFVADGETAASLETCLSQLPFSDATIKSGGITKAIKHLGAERSPENIIVDISGTDMPASRVHDLAQLCEPGVTVVAIGDRNDIGLYRDLVQAGVSEYVVKPITPQLLAKALSPRLTPAEGIPVSRKLGKVVAFLGGSRRRWHNDACGEPSVVSCRSSETPSPASRSRPAER